MYKTIFPILAIIGSILAFGLRFGQQSTGFDATTGLAEPGNPFAMGLLALLIGAFVSVCLLGRKIDPTPTSFNETFSGGTLQLMLMVGGCFLIGGSGALMAYKAFGVSQWDLVLGLLHVFGGVGLLCVVPACRAGSTKQVDGTFALVCVIAAVVTLIVSYRQVSINPVIWVYAMEILALALSLLALFYITGFAFSLGQPRGFARSATLAIVLCGGAVADGYPLPYTLLFVGYWILLLGFLLSFCRYAGSRV